MELMATAQSRLTSTDTHAYFDRSKHVDRLEVNAYFGRSKTTLLYIFMTDDWKLNIARQIF